MSLVATLLFCCREMLWLQPGLLGRMVLVLWVSLCVPVSREQWQGCPLAVLTGGCWRHQRLRAQLGLAGSEQCGHQLKISLSLVFEGEDPPEVAGAAQRCGSDACAGPNTKQIPTPWICFQGAPRAHLHHLTLPGCTELAAVPCWHRWDCCLCLSQHQVLAAGAP